MAESDFLEIHEGTAPLVVSLPHVGTRIPESIACRLVDRRRGLRDTDWYVDQLYDFACDLGATVIRTDLSRTVADVNRDPSGQSLYPGMTTTELCPTTTFDGDPLYKSGEEPSPSEIAQRIASYHAPYHRALSSALTRLKTLYPKVVLYDCHSIRSRLPRLFEGTLPHLNLGVNGAVSASRELVAQVVDVMRDSTFDHVVDGRFRGGWITRNYGKPASGIEAIQMEIAVRSYLREPDGPVTEETWPIDYDPEYARPLKQTLSTILEVCLQHAWE